MHVKAWTAADTHGAGQWGQREVAFAEQECGLLPLWFEFFMNQHLRVHSCVHVKQEKQQAAAALVFSVLALVQGVVAYNLLQCSDQPTGRWADRGMQSVDCCRVCRLLPVH